MGFIDKVVNKDSNEKRRISHNINVNREELCINDGLPLIKRVKMKYNTSSNENDSKANNQLKKKTHLRFKTLTNIPTFHKNNKSCSILDSPAQFNYFLYDKKMNVLIRDNPLIKSKYKEYIKEKKRKSIYHSNHYVPLTTRHTHTTSINYFNKTQENNTFKSSSALNQEIKQSKQLIIDIESLQSIKRKKKNKAITLIQKQNWTVENDTKILDLFHLNVHKKSIRCLLKSHDFDYLSKNKVITSRCYN